jgi:N-acetylglucosaminyl-diphospho-decaprenol L-rhamnosyltransferase
LIAISLVSHGHGEMVSNLVKQLLKYPEVSKIFITFNICEDLNLPNSLKIHKINNPYPKGFAENHNNALLTCKLPYFCPLNPDVSLLKNPFPPLIEGLKTLNADLIAPKILNTSGQIEDSVRYFPTIYSLLKKFFFKSLGSYSMEKHTEIFSPDWVAGMFMLFKAPSYISLRGFDENFFLYYEDVDICARAWEAGMKIIVDPSVSVVHNARRSSRKNITYLILHFKSMLRYLLKNLGGRPRFSRRITDG